MHCFGIWLYRKIVVLRAKTVVLHAKTVVLPACLAKADEKFFFLQAKLEKIWKILSHFAYIKSGDRVPPL